jgi:DNA-binding transcriptional LysR family regulator
MRLGFVTGATPDKWARAWRERRTEPLELVPVTEADQERAIREGEVDMCLVRLPIDREGLHLVTLYEEVAVAAAGRDHFIAAADEVSTEDLGDEQLVRPHASGWHPEAEQLAWPSMTEQEAIETVASGTGVVIVPASVARLFQRKDVITRPVIDLDPTQVGLAWRIDRDGEDTQTFVGIVKGRTARSTR